jgi:hypothetical protein
MTKLEIINSALELASLSRIGSVADPSANGKTAAGFYPLAIGFVLRSDLWPCALTYASLVENTAAENSTSYGHLYTMPVLCLKICKVNGRESGYAWILSPSSLLACDDTSVKLVYITDLSSTPESMPADLARAVVYELATEIAEAKEIKRASLLRVEARDALLLARCNAGYDRPAESAPSTAWVDA